MGYEDEAEALESARVKAERSDKVRIADLEKLVDDGKKIEVLPSGEIRVFDKDHRKCVQLIEQASEHLKARDAELSCLRAERDALAAENRVMRKAIKRALADSESGKGWGPDITVCGYLRDAIHAKIVREVERPAMKRGHPSACLHSTDDGRSFCCRCEDVSSLAAENRMMREALTVCAGSANSECWRDSAADARHALQDAPHTTREVERVTAMEAVVEAARAQNAGTDDGRPEYDLGSKLAALDKIGKEK